jgi:hypothetical protein
MSDTPIVISKEAILKPQLPEEVIDVAGLGPVRVRGLSRSEWMANKDRDGVEWEIGLLAVGLVDPKLSEEEIRQMREATTVKVIDEIASGILRLSGMLVSRGGDAKRTFQEEQ